MGVAGELTGRLNEKYNGIEYYFRLKSTNEALVKENERLHQLVKDNYQEPGQLKPRYSRQPR